jgi:uncharacterized protein YjbJ (UPF0337 family)
MGFIDKLLGRSKQAAGDLKGDESMSREGMHQEREGEAEARAESAEEKAQEAREEAAQHHAERDS